MNRPFRTRPRQTDPDTCDTVDPLLSLYADGMASEQEVRRVETHLPGCAACRQSLLWMQATRKALAMRPIQLPPADLRARIASAIAVPAQARPARVFTLRPAYVAAASLTLVGVVAGVGYGLLKPHSPSAPPTPLSVKTPQIAQTPPIELVPPTVKPMTSPSPVVHHHPKHTPLALPSLVANTPPDLAPENDSADAPPAPSAKHAEAPAPTPVYQAAPPVAPHPRRLPLKKPVLRTPSPRLMALKSSGPIVDHAPKLSLPVTVHSEKSPEMARLPVTPPDAPVSVPVTAPPPRVIREEPAPPVREASAPHPSEGSFHTVDLSSAKEYAHTHQASLEHDLSLTGQRAVRTAVHTTAFTAGLDGSPSGNIDIVHSR